jgi:hypothetical protein
VDFRSDEENNPHPTPSLRERGACDSTAVRECFVICAFERPSSFVISCPCAGNWNKENGQDAPFAPQTRCLCYCACRAAEHNSDIVWVSSILEIC